MSRPSRRTVKVAIVGSGLAGLTAAHLLTSANEHADANGTTSPIFDVHLFEKASSVGMDAYSIDCETEDGPVRIDVPMRSFQGGYYPNLIALYKSLGVDFRISNFSYSFSWLAFASKNSSSLALRPHLIYNGASGRGGASFPSRWLDDTRQAMTKSKQSSWFTELMLLPQIILCVLFLLQLFYHFLRLHALSVPMLFRQNSTETLAEWTQRTTPSNFVARAFGFDVAWTEFVDKVVIPLFSAVCTAPADDIYQHPVNEILEYVILTLGTNHYVVNEGVADAVRRITKSLSPSRLHLSSTIHSISQDFSNRSTSSISFSTPSGPSSISGFDHIILATQANQAIPLLDTLRASYAPKSRMQRATDAQIACLRRFKYVPTIVVNHRDTSFIPSNPSDIRDLNLVCAHPDEMDERLEASRMYEKDAPYLPPGYAMATHVIKPRTPSKSGRPHSAIFQTTNPLHPPRIDSILSIARIERAVLTVDSKLAQRSLVSVGRGRWVLIWIGFRTGNWLPFTVEHSRPRKLGTLQAPGRQSADDTGVWLCGSYAHPGIPLLEACVTSALAVVENGIFEVEGVRYRPDWAVHC